MAHAHAQLPRFFVSSTTWVVEAGTASHFASYGCGAADIELQRGRQAG